MSWLGGDAHSQKMDYDNESGSEAEEMNLDEKTGKEEGGKPEEEEGGKPEEIKGDQIHS